MASSSVARPEGVDDEPGAVERPSAPRRRRPTGCRARPCAIVTTRSAGDGGRGGRRRLDRDDDEGGERRRRERPKARDPEQRCSSLPAHRGVLRGGDGLVAARQERGRRARRGEGGAGEAPRRRGVGASRGDDARHRPDRTVRGRTVPAGATIFGYGPVLPRGSPRSARRIAGLAEFAVLAAGSPTPAGALGAGRRRPRGLACRRAALREGGDQGVPAGSRHQLVALPADAGTTSVSSGSRVASQPAPSERQRGRRRPSPRGACAGRVEPGRRVEQVEREAGTARESVRRCPPRGPPAGCRARTRRERLRRVERAVGRRGRGPSRRRGTSGPRAAGARRGGRRGRRRGACRPGIRTASPGRTAWRARRSAAGRRPGASPRGHQPRGRRADADEQLRARLGLDDVPGLGLADGVGTREPARERVVRVDLDGQPCGRVEELDEEREARTPAGAVPPPDERPARARPRRPRACGRHIGPRRPRSMAATHSSPMAGRAGARAASRPRRAPWRQVRAQGDEHAPEPTPARRRSLPARGRARCPHEAALVAARGRALAGARDPGIVTAGRRSARSCAGVVPGQCHATRGRRRLPPTPARRRPPADAQPARRVRGVAGGPPGGARAPPRARRRRSS